MQSRELLKLNLKTCRGMTLQIIESNNPFYQEELKRQFSSASDAVATSGSPTAT